MSDFFSNYLLTNVKEKYIVDIIYNYLNDLYQLEYITYNNESKYNCFFHKTVKDMSESDRLFYTEHFLRFLIQFDCKKIKECECIHCRRSIHKELFWAVISKKMYLSKNFIKEFQDKLNWKILSRRYIYDENFIREFQDKLDWNTIGISQDLLNENFIREFQDKLNWDNVSRKLNENLIKKFQDKIIWNNINSKMLSIEFIQKFQHKFSFSNIFKKIIDDDFTINLEDILELKKKIIFRKIKKLYGKHSSFAIWNENDFNDVSLINYNDIQLKYIFVGLNPSREIENIDFKNFHNNFRGNKNNRFKYINNSKFKNSYMTDIFKDLIEVNSSKIKRWIKNNPEKAKKYLKNFEEEIKILEIKNPIIIAFGNEVYDILKKNFNYNIHKISHYSARIKNEIFYEEIKKLENKI